MLNWLNPDQLGEICTNIKSSNPSELSTYIWPLLQELDGDGHTDAGVPLPKPYFVATRLEDGPLRYPPFIRSYDRDPKHPAFNHPILNSPESFYWSEKYLGLQQMANPRRG